MGAQPITQLEILQPDTSWLDEHPSRSCHSTLGYQVVRVRDRFLDKSLIGYTSLGYRWRPHPDIRADLRGRTAVVTGATSGLGKSAASELLRLGATVCLVGRSRDKTERVAKALVERTGSSAVEVEVADLSLMSEVRALAGRLQAPIHILVNNAGVLLPTRTETEEGIETTFATNLLGHFLLTNLLVSKLAGSPSAPARIINVSSGGMYTQGLSVDDLESASGRYDGAKTYARTKRGQVVLTELWARALAHENIVVHAMHPGWADTPGVSRSLPRFYKLTKPLLRSPEQGADTIVWLCASDEAARCTGRFWHDRIPRPTHRLAKTRETEQERRAFWAELCRYTGWSGTLDPPRDHE